MESMNEVRWGIIGVGDVCEIKSGPALQRVPGSQLMAVMRRNELKARDFAQRHKVEKWYSNADQLIHDPDINAIYIATPPSSHCDYVMRAAAAGKPVYVEKPMAMSVGECEQMISACRQAKVPLFVAYYRRSLPNFLQIKNLIDSGAIGEVRTVQIELFKSLRQDHDCISDDNWRVDPDVAGGGYFFDLACHQLDFLDFLLGPIKHAAGFATNQAGAYRAEDVVTGSFSFENGITGSGIWCFSSSKIASKEMTTIIGTKGIIKFDFFGPMKVTIETESAEIEELQFDIPKHIQEPLIQSIVGELMGNDTCPSTGETAIRTNQIMSKICQRID